MCILDPIKKEADPMLKENEVAPDFTLDSDSGEAISLSRFRGQKVVLYFYPKDETSGCIKEACSFRDDYSQFLAKGAVVIGVSPDEPESHQKFRMHYGLPYYLLSDPDHKVADIYGAWGERTIYGKSSMGILRSTFVIGEDGKIVKIFSKVNPEGHAQEVLPFL
jgi:thioredoxin-dependent peroxiredoxin